MVKDSIIISEKQKVLILSVLPVFFIISALVMDTPANILKGLYDIIITPDLLLTDYVYIGGLSATLINSGILTLISIALFYKLRVHITGITIAALFAVAGFAFFGKNIANVWPIYIGGYLYCRYHKIQFKNVVLILTFGTALAPMVSQLAHGTSLSMPVGLFLGVSLSVLAGFILPVLAPHMLSFHDGYNLYNVGFTAGIIGTMLTSVMRSFGFTIESRMILSTQHDFYFKMFLIGLCIFLFVIGFIINGNSIKGYTNILKHSGRLVTDFTQLDGFGITFMNMGIMGLTALVYIIISKGTINGPIVGGTLTCMGFSAFGNHPKNTIPILLGVILATFTNIWDISSTSVIIGGLFGTTLAPIAGAYGSLGGILAGFLHLSVVMNVGYLHGGINLYNNGFSGGIVAAVLVPILKSFKKDK